MRSTKLLVTTRTRRAHEIVVRSRSRSFPVASFRVVERHRVARCDCEWQRSFTRNEGVRGSNPRVGFNRFAGKDVGTGCARAARYLEHTAAKPYSKTRAATGQAELELGSNEPSAGVSATGENRRPLHYAAWGVLPMRTGGRAAVERRLELERGLDLARRCRSDRDAPSLASDCRRAAVLTVSPSALKHSSAGASSGRSTTGPVL